MLSITIDLARGLASFAVFLFHIAEQVRPYSSGWFVLAKYGFYGVPLFFVISGYCITASADGFISKQDSPLKFLKKRFLRIYPPFWASILVILCVPYLLEIVSYIRTGQLAWPYRDWQNFNLTDWVQVITLIKVFYGSDGQSLHSLFSGINPVYWSLAIEFQFYLVVFLALLSKKHFVNVLAIVTFVSLFFQDIRYTGLFLGYWPLFAVGICVYYLLKNNLTLLRLSRSWGLLLSVFLVLTITVLVIYFARQGQLDNVLRKFGDDWLNFAILCALALWAISPMEPMLKRCINSINPMFSFPLKCVTLLGTISYSLYLLHPKMYQISEKVADNLSLSHSFLKPIVIVLGTVLISWVFYHFCERPFIQSRIRTQRNMVC
ncbi:acyltransferase [Methylomonas montana]|uniref:acyltransferase family protein n=1 Tax=Methylomonas montana TaxID=3058963 RepID=UPI0026583B00|nr:acyltransferase [Methylomonas montana]WKJ89305.1 acyltransferase [Methylomonas montana]